MTDRELLQQALDAERRFDKFLGEFDDDTQERILRYALDHFVPNMKSRRLAQPEPKPVAWAVPNTRPTEKARFMMLLHSPDVQYPEQLVPLYTAPPQREWQGLKDEEIGAMEKEYLFGGKEFDDEIGYWAVYRAIEAKLKEKNT